MSIIKTSLLPTYSRLAQEGYPIMSNERAIHQDMREIHIGFLNLMPDAAVEAAERQFYRLVAEGAGRTMQVHIHPFTLPVFERGDVIREHMKAHYETFEQIAEQGLDGLIITGASEETNPPITDACWKPLQEVMEWSQGNVSSTLCSCFASHAAMHFLYDQTPQWQDQKTWGVFSHRINPEERQHPLVRGMNTRIDVPHSRYNVINHEQFERAGARILIESKEAGVHLATSRDGISLVMMQGHPEYDTISLLKEYRREVQNFTAGTRADYPPAPAHYFPEGAQAVADNYAWSVSGKSFYFQRKRDSHNHGDFAVTVPGSSADMEHRSRNYGNSLFNGKAAFPENALAEAVENTWADSGRTVMSSWVGAVYRLTNIDRHEQFMPGVDPNRPLEFLKMDVK